MFSGSGNGTGINTVNQSGKNRSGKFKMAANATELRVSWLPDEIAT